jgi:hypothetical protein
VHPQEIESQKETEGKKETPVCGGKKQRVQEKTRKYLET